MTEGKSIAQIIVAIALVACANMAGAQWYSTPSQNRGYGSSAYGAGGTTYYNNAYGSRQIKVLNVITTEMINQSKEKR